MKNISSYSPIPFDRGEDELSFDIYTHINQNLKGLKRKEKLVAIRAYRRDKGNRVLINSCEADM